MIIQDLHAFVINVPKEIHRYYSFLNKTAKNFPIPIQHISAIPLNESVNYARLKTLKRIREISQERTICKTIEIARENNWDNILIFEDDCDCVFSKEVMEQIISEIPKNYQVCYLGCYIRNSGSGYFKKYSDHLLKIFGNNMNIWGFHAVILSRFAYEKIYAVLSNPKNDSLSDRILCNLVNSLFTEVYLVNPCACYQTAELNKIGFKSLHNTNFNFRELERKHNSLVSKGIRK